MLSSNEIHEEYNYILRFPYAVYHSFSTISIINPFYNIATILHLKNLTLLICPNCNYLNIH